MPEAAAPKCPPAEAAPGSKSNRGHVARNMVFNWAGMAGEAIVGFLLLPLLLDRLGDTAYGLWVIIGSMTGFFLLLDLGMRGSIGRFVALHRAQDDLTSINRVVSTSLAILAGMGLVATLAVLGMSFFCDRLIEIPSSLQGDVRTAFALVAANLGVWFVLQAFDAILWGFQRFDLLNLIDLPAAFLRLGLCYLLVDASNGLWMLGAITLGMTLLIGSFKLIAAMSQDSRLSIRPRFVGLSSAHELFGYGWWAFLEKVAALAKKSMTPIVIGAVISPAAVTLYAIARRLVDYAGMFVMVAAGVLTPIAAGIHSEGNDARQRRLFLVGSKYIISLMLYFVVGEIILGATFIRLWVGPDFQAASVLLILLVCGDAIGLGNYVARSVLLGAAKHRVIAWISSVEVAFGVGGAAIGAYLFGLPGAVAAVATATLVFSGVVLMYFACKAIGVPLGHFLREAWLPALGSALGPTIVLGAMYCWLRPDDWLMFIVCGVAFTAAWGLSSLVSFAELRVTPQRWKAIYRG